MDRNSSFRRALRTAEPTAPAAYPTALAANRKRSRPPHPGRASPRSPARYLIRPDCVAREGADRLRGNAGIGGCSHDDAPRRRRPERRQAAMRHQAAMPHRAPGAGGGAERLSWPHREARCPADRPFFAWASDVVVWPTKLAAR